MGMLSAPTPTGPSTNPCVPRPATVNVAPLESETRRTTLLPWSAT
jgi:hypothetical protein